MKWSTYRLKFHHPSYVNLIKLANRRSSGRTKKKKIAYYIHVEVECRQVINRCVQTVCRIIEFLYEKYHGVVKSIYIYFFLARSKKASEFKYECNNDLLKLSFLMHKLSRTRDTNWNSSISSFCIVISVYNKIQITKV